MHCVSLYLFVYVCARAFIHARLYVLYFSMSAYVCVYTHGCLCMCTFECVCACVFLCYVHVSIYHLIFMFVYVFLHVYKYIITCVCMCYVSRYLHLCLCVHARVCMCTFEWVCVCARVCRHLCVCWRWDVMIQVAKATRTVVNLKAEERCDCPE